MAKKPKEKIYFKPPTDPRHWEARDSYLFHYKDNRKSITGGGSYLYATGLLEGRIKSVNQTIKWLRSAGGFWRLEDLKTTPEYGERLALKHLLKEVEDIGRNDFLRKMK